MGSKSEVARIAELEAEVERLRVVIQSAAGLLASRYFEALHPDEMESYGRELLATIGGRATGGDATTGEEETP